MAPAKAADGSRENAALSALPTLGADLAGTGAMASRSLLRIALVTVLVGGVSWTADALVETDEERIGELADSFGGEVSERRLDRALAFVDTAQEPVEVITPRGIDWYEDPSDAGLLAEAIRDAVSPYLGARARLVQRSVDVDGDDATLAVRVDVDGHLADVQLRLRRQADDRWLIRRVRLL